MCVCVCVCVQSFLKILNLRYNDNVPHIKGKRLVSSIYRCGNSIREPLT